MATPDHFDTTCEWPRWPGVTEHRGEGDAAGLRIALVVSRFNLRHTAALLRGAVETLLSLGARPGDLEVAWVPGAYEIPLVVEALAARRTFDAVCALGCVIEGETPHAALINSTVAATLSEISRRHGVPVLDAVVPARTEAQAATRCGPGPDNRGAYAARAAVEMARLMARLRRASP